MRPSIRGVLGMLALASGCAAGSQPARPALLDAGTLVASLLPGILAEDLGPVPAITEGYPALLDDAELRQMYRRRQGFAFEAFYEERGASGRIPWSDLMEHQRPLCLDYEATALGRLDRELDAHYLRWRSQIPETAASLSALLHAAEATLYYDFELAAHLWTHARTLEPPPAALLGRLDHHLRVNRALHLGAEVTGPVRWNASAGSVDVPAGLAAAAARAFPGADAGSFDTYGTLPLTVLRGRVVLVRRGVEQTVSTGEALELRRLDVLRAPAAATLGHAVFGALVLAAGADLGEGSVHRVLGPDQVAQVEALVAATRDGDRLARAVVEANLPLTYPYLRASYAGTPSGIGDNDAIRILYEYEGIH